MRVVPVVCAALTLGGLSAGCAHRTATGRAGAAGDAKSGAQAVIDTGPQATGTWDWMIRTNEDDGNIRVEQEEWHLVQKGGAVEGYYDRAVTRISTDDRLFKCNQQLGYTRFTRVRVQGTVERGRLKIREIDYRTRPGPCDDGARILVSYDGEVAASTLRLWFAEKLGLQTLHRREGQAPALAQLVGFDDAPRPPPPAARSNAPVTGVWEWELKSIDADGDERVEREEWHLEENADGITGFYDRTVRRTRGDGVFTCNSRPTYQSQTRYDVQGQRAGDTVSLSETAYHADRTICDNGIRRLDSYRGSVSKAGELILMWPSGTQVLRRKAAMDATPVVGKPADAPPPAGATSGLEPSPVAPASK